MITIRPLADQDPLHDLVSLSRQFFAEYQAYHPDFFEIDALLPEHVQAYFSRFLNNPDALALIALDSDLPGTPIVAYLTVSIKLQPGYWAVKRAGEISGLMVAPTHRRRGIASRLLHQARSFLAARGIRYFTLYTALSNHAALAFYRAHGLTPLHTTLLGEIPLAAPPPLQPSLP